MEASTHKNINPNFKLFLVIVAAVIVALSILYGAYNLLRDDEPAMITLGELSEEELSLPGSTPLAVPGSIPEGPPRPAPRTATPTDIKELRSLLADIGTGQARELSVFGEYPKNTKEYVLYWASKVNGCTTQEQCQSSQWALQKVRKNLSRGVSDYNTKVKLFYSDSLPEDIPLQLDENGDPA